MRMFSDFVRLHPKVAMDLLGFGELAALSLLIHHRINVLKRDVNRLNLVEFYPPILSLYGS